MFKQTEIASLQPPAIADVLQRWQAEVNAKFDAVGMTYDDAPSVAKGREHMQLNSLRQQFLTTIPAIRQQRLGWPKDLAALIVALEEVGLVV